MNFVIEDVVPEHSEKVQRTCTRQETDSPPPDSQQTNSTSQSRPEVYACNGETSSASGGRKPRRSSPADSSSLLAARSGLCRPLATTFRIINGDCITNQRKYEVITKNRETAGSKLKMVANFAARPREQHH